MLGMLAMYGEFGIWRRMGLAWKMNCWSFRPFIVLHQHFRKMNE
jgi:hypothetical protein